MHTMCIERTQNKYSRKRHVYSKVEINVRTFFFKQLHVEIIESYPDGFVY